MLDYFLWKSIKNIQFYYFSQNILTKITGTLCEDQYAFLIMSRSDPLRMRNVADKRCRETKTHILYSNNSFENRAFYKIMQKKL
jgi:hypothetical protein